MPKNNRDPISRRIARQFSEHDSLSLSNKSYSLLTDFRTLSTPHLQSSKPKTRKICPRPLLLELRCQFVAHGDAWDANKGGRTTTTTTNSTKKRTSKNEDDNERWHPFFFATRSIEMGISLMLCARGSSRIDAIFALDALSFDDTHTDTHPKTYIFAVLSQMIKLPLRRSEERKIYKRRFNRSWRVCKWRLGDLGVACFMCARVAVNVRCVHGESGL